VINYETPYTVYSVFKGPQPELRHRQHSGFVEPRSLSPPPPLSKRIIAVRPRQLYPTIGKRRAMDLVIIAITVCFLLLAAGFGTVFARLISRDRIALPISESDAIFSPNRYRVVERLLAEADLRAVKSVGDRRAEREFRKVRLKIFRGYMLQLRRLQSNL
jgi:hypothetical protein